MRKPRSARVDTPGGLADLLGGALRPKAFERVIERGQQRLHSRIELLQAVGRPIRPISPLHICAIGIPLPDKWVVHLAVLRVAVILGRRVAEQEEVWGLKALDRVALRNLRESVRLPETTCFNEGRECEWVVCDRALLRRVVVHLRCCVMRRAAYVRCCASLVRVDA